MNPYTQCVRKGILVCTEVRVYGLYNEQYTSISLYYCILLCVDYHLTEGTGWNVH